MLRSPQYKTTSLSLNSYPLTNNKFIVINKILENIFKFCSYVYSTMDRTIKEAKCLHEGKRHDDVCLCCGKEIHFVLKNEGLSKCAGTFCASGQNDEKELREFAVEQALRRIEWNVLPCRWKLWRCANHAILP